MGSEAAKVARRWAVLIAATLAFFYAMDHLLMSAQGLPLTWSMAPRN